MATLKLYLLGPLQVCHGQQCLSRFATAKVQQLLGYLCVHRERLHSRDVLSELLWGEASEELARGNLRTCLWRLRGVLETEKHQRGQYLIVDRDGIGFNTRSDYWLDLQEFEEVSRVERRWSATDSPTIAATIGRLTTAVSLYRGDLLDGCYEDWCLFERERLKEIYLRNLSHLMMLHRRTGNYADAIEYGQRLLRHDPLLEEVHREVMQLHCLAGNRAAAVRQFQTCRRLLRQELDIEPMEETTSLYASIVAERNHTVQEVPTPSLQRPPSLETALVKLRAVQDEFDRLGHRLREGVTACEALQREVDSADRG